MYLRYSFKVVADSTEDYKKAADLKMRECTINDQIAELNKKIKLKNLTLQDVAQVIENWTKIPQKVKWNMVYALPFLLIVQRHHSLHILEESQ